MAERNPLSRVEKILDATIKGTSYDAPPLSRVEEDLLELKASIDAGGGGGTGTKDYNEFINKPSINGHELVGNQTSEDLDIKGSTTNIYNPSDEEVIMGGGTGGQTHNTYDSEEENLIIGS